MKVICHCDGGARQQGLVAGAGAVVYDTAGNELAARAHFMQRVTVPQAEYTGLILALTMAAELGATSVEVLMDAELIARQFNGTYRCQKAHLKPLLALARAHAARFEICVVREFPKAGPRMKRRYGNVRADELANIAMDTRAHFQADEIPLAASG